MCLISVDPRKRDWQRLNRKISKGIPLESAAVQMGIPMEEVFSYISGRMEEYDTLNFELRRMAQGALKKGLGKLSELAAGGQRVSERSEATIGEARSINCEKLVSDDLDAAKALVKFGIDALKLSRTPSPQDKDTGKDLFDVANERGNGPWILKKVE